MIQLKEPLWVPIIPLQPENFKAISLQELSEAEDVYVTLKDALVKMIVLQIDSEVILQFVITELKEMANFEGFRLEIINLCAHYGTILNPDQIATLFSQFDPHQAEPKSVNIQLRPKKT